MLELIEDTVALRPDQVEYLARDRGDRVADEDRL